MHQFRIPRDPQGLVYFIRLVVRSQVMRVEVVTHLRDRLRSGLTRMIDQPFRLLRPVGGRLGVPSSPERFNTYVLGTVDPPSLG